MRLEGAAGVRRQDRAHPCCFSWYSVDSDREASFSAIVRGVGGPGSEDCGEDMVGDVKEVYMWRMDGEMFKFDGYTEEDSKSFVLSGSRA